MSAPLLRGLANVVIVVGAFLLLKVMYHSATGVLVGQVLPHPQGQGWLPHAFALGLSLGVPLHVISVGMVLQKKWLSPPWARTSRIAVMVSGFWLGAALGVKTLVLP